MNSHTALAPLKNVHELLNESAGSPLSVEPPAVEPETKTTTAAFRLDRADKELIDQICQRHATTLSAFLRQVCKQVISDYRPN